MSNFWKGKKVVITGASGFIGSNACAFYARLGCKVTGIISPQTNHQKTAINLGQVKKQIAIRQADLLSTKDVDAILQGQEILMHFAGIDGGLQFKQLHSADIFSHNMRINLNVLESSAKHAIKQLLLISSADIYKQYKRASINEKSPLAIDVKKEMDGYKLAKWSTELAAKEYNRQFQMNTIIIRPSNVYGPHDEFEDEKRIRFIPAMIKYISHDKPVTLWGNGEQIRSFLFVDDFLNICKKLIEKKVYNTPINVASANNVSLRNLAGLIMQLLGKELPVRVDVGKPEGAQMREFDLSLLKKKIGEYKETDLVHGLEKTIAFYRRNYL